MDFELAAKLWACKKLGWEPADVGLIESVEINHESTGGCESCDYCELSVEVTLTEEAGRARVNRGELGTWTYRSRYMSISPQTWELGALLREILDASEPTAPVEGHLGTYD